MILWLILLTMLVPSAATAATISGDPLPVMQQNPAMMRYLDPRPTSAHALPQGKQQFRLQTHYTSLFLADQLPAARRYLADMEIFIADAAIRYGIGNRSDLTLALPLMRPLAGVMDQFLHRYHRALGLPNSGRELRPNNQYGYRYQQQWNSRPRWETGNLQITWKKGLATNQPWALLAAIQLPTANKNRGWGHDGIDLGLGAVTSWQRDVWFGHGEGWWLHPFAHHDLNGTNRDYLRLSATVGHRFPAWSPPIQALLQVQGGSSPYRTGIAALDSAPWLISFGLRGVTRNGWQWNAAFVENITQSSTQDFGLTFGVTIPTSD